MAFYHCSTKAGLKSLRPGKPKTFDKPARVYMTTLLPMALMYCIDHYEYTYGYTQDGQIYYAEHFPNALEILYRGKSASLYLCAPEAVETTKIPNEAVSVSEVSILEETRIPDACEALLEQERLGALVIKRYESLTEKNLEWIRRVEADSIREYGLLNKSGPMADFFRTHYPDSWRLVQEEADRNA